MIKVKVNYREKPQCPLWSPNRAPWQRPPLSLPGSSGSTTVSCREECLIHAGIQLEVRSQSRTLWYLTAHIHWLLQCLSAVPEEQWLWLWLWCRTFPYTPPCTVDVNTFSTSWEMHQQHRTHFRTRGTSIGSSEQELHIMLDWILWLTVATYLQSE